MNGRQESENIQEKNGKTSGQQKKRKNKTSGNRTAGNVGQVNKRKEGIGSLSIKGLTFSEWSKYIKLKRKLKRFGKDNGRTDTAQKSVPFMKMYPDGVCRVRKNYYTAMVGFDDVGYELYSEGGRRSFLEVYERIFARFDPETHVEVFCMNRKSDGTELESRICIPKKCDGFDEIREEYVGIIRDQAMGMNGSIVRNRYIIMGVTVSDRTVASERLETMCSETVKDFENLGSHAWKLDGTERLKVLRDYLCQTGKDGFDFSYEKMKAEGRDEKYYIVPKSFNFAGSKDFMTGKTYGQAMCVELKAVKLNDELIRNILNIDDTFSVAFHIDVMDPVKAMKLVKGKLSDVQKSKVDEQQKAVRSGFDMDILSPNIVAYESNIMGLTNALNTSTMKLVDDCIMITCFGKSRKKLNALCQRITGIINSSSNTVNPMEHLQEQTFMSTAPIGIKLMAKKRTITSRCVAVMEPFRTSELFQRGESFYYGINALSNNIIMADRKQLRTPNGLILGTPGSGKSFAAKREMLSCFLQTNDDIIVADPEGEYYPLVELLGGQRIRLASDSAEFLNPMDIQLSSGNDRDELKLKSDFIITLCDMIAGGMNGLENDEKGIIDECIRHIYDDYLNDPKPENMPVLGDLHKALMDHRNPKAERIANSLVLYTSGSQNYFNHRTNVDSDNRLICFDIKDLGRQLKPIGMLVVQDAVWNRVSLNGKHELCKAESGKASGRTGEGCGAYRESKNRPK